MITRTHDHRPNNLGRPKEVGEVWISSSESEAFSMAGELRRRIPRGGGWKVRTNKRSVKSDGLKVNLWVVTSTRPEQQMEPSMCSPDDPSNGLSGRSN